ncbi:AAA-like domain-containing protein [Chryseobacterium sp. JJR-5R]|uniref:AAA-like domain-containing protein n=1 Tax=Chryseobacterium sp. JJR-5R TaxID=3093923 RepID=UPI002A75DD90|nr:AAA-like domain-containing protein [Chryseobacterium sp. JJR-5R]WPO82665.1 AAA-like domain-containing protein [Chryseobacterium sp. JJR-5R]
MERVLKKYTTIPEHLYIERNADIQLQRIIEDMQRPGYVLVARQMGKTNLLFNAKRKLENNERLLAYVDLSNPFENERECYRNIINNIVEPNIDIFESIEDNIIAIRNKNIPAHSEYSRCLIQILNHIEGDLVIILDEIDALKSVEYSDNIFAQIRSNYFSRTNFPVFERLTYVLSGVIEPTELIKDKNKSPFNIGEKIYLDDFSKTEHNSFIKKSKLKIDSKISDYIYDWTSGNPRMTFDLCADIETFIIENNYINESIVDNIINKKYLTNYDIAPIDHIRELVKANKELRDSVIQIINCDNDINDFLKSKLYLYGIISSNFNAEIRIKNKIIEETLNLTWIKSVEKSSKNLYNYGLQNIDDKNWSEAISNLTEYLENNDIGPKEHEIGNYNLGFAYYSQRNFEQALKYFSKEYKIVKTLTKNAPSFKGMSLISIGQIEEGKKILEEVIEQKGNDFPYRNSLLNLANLVMDEDSGKALALFNELYDSTFEARDNANEIDLNHIRVLCLFYIAEIKIKKENNEEALQSIDNALEICDANDAPFLIYYKIRILLQPEDELYERLVRAIVDNKVLFINEELNPLNFNYLVLYYYLNELFGKNDNKFFLELLEYSEKVLLTSIDRDELIYTISTISEDKHSEILNYLLKSGIVLSERILYNVYKDLSFDNLENHQIFFNYFDKYFSLVDYRNIDPRDLYLFAYCIKKLNDNNDFKKAVDYAKQMQEILDTITDDSLNYASIVIYFWISNVYFALNKRTQTLLYVEKTLHFITLLKDQKSSMLDEKAIEAIKLQAATLKTYFPSDAIIKKKYGRNEKIKVKYRNGIVVEKKYKYLEFDINSHKCFII